MTRQFSALILLFCSAGMAGAEDPARASLGDSRFIAGGEAVLDSPIRGNAFAAGGRVDGQPTAVRAVPPPSYEDDDTVEIPVDPDYLPRRRARGRLQGIGRQLWRGDDDD